MKIKALISALIATATVAGPAAANDDIVRGIFGLGAALLLNEASRQNQPPRYREQAPGRRYTNQQDGELLAARKEIQHRLNLLGYEAGFPDGVFGRQTRNAIAAFQTGIGREPSGKISEEEIGILYARTNGGAPGTAVAGTPPPVTFPPVGAANGQAAGFAPGFPPVGQNGPPPGGSAFPTLGGTASQTQGGSAFPALGGGAQPAPGQAAPAFPINPAQKTITAGAGGFPALGKPVAASAGAFPIAAPASAAKVPPEGGFPQLVAPQEAQPAAKLPELSTAAPSSSAFPSLGTTGTNGQDAAALPKLATPPDLSEAPPADLTSELAHTPFGSADKQPMILGFSLGGEFLKLKDHLSAEGFSECKQGGFHIQCIRKTETLSDTIRIWPSNAGVISGLARSIEFNKPVPLAALKTQFEGNYAELMATPSKTIASKPACAASTMNMDNIRSLLDNMSPYDTATAAQIDKHLYDTAFACPVGYSLAFVGEETVSAVELTFHDATPILRYADQLKKEEEQAKQNQPPKAEVISTDFKL